MSPPVAALSATTLDGTAAALTGAAALRSRAAAPSATFQRTKRGVAIAEYSVRPELVYSGLFILVLGQVSAGIGGATLMRIKRRSGGRRRGRAPRSSPAVRGDCRPFGAARRHSCDRGVSRHRKKQKNPRHPRARTSGVAIGLR